LEDVNVEEEGTMTSTELYQQAEIERIEAWRMEELERAGYAADEAAVLATRHDVDLHTATDLLGRGCPADTALRILL
jgi:hypothetical protein